MPESSGGVLGWKPSNGSALLRLEGIWPDMTRRVIGLQQMQLIYYLASERERCLFG